MGHGSGKCCRFAWTSTRRAVSTEPGKVLIRLARGDGDLLESDGRPFHDAPVRPATAAEVSALARADAAPDRARLEVGELALAPGVPFSLDAGGFGRHTFLCGQSGSGKTYSLGVLVEQLLMQTDLRVVVLDPNSDYVRLGEPSPQANPDSSARYEAVAGRWWCAAGRATRLESGSAYETSARPSGGGPASRPGRRPPRVRGAPHPGRGREHPQPR